MSSLKVVCQYRKKLIDLIIVSIQGGFLFGMIGGSIVVQLPIFITAIMIIGTLIAVFLIKVKYTEIYDEYIDSINILSDQYVKQQSKTIIFNKEYNGFEDTYDIDRDLHEMWDSDFNELVKDIPDEFQGTVEITVTYEEEE